MQNIQIFSAGVTLTIGRHQ